jgi:hypothetical protein
MTPIATQAAQRSEITARPIAPDDAERLKRDFAANGYVVLRSVVPAGPLDALRAMILEEFERARRARGLFPGGGLVTGHINCFPGEASRFVHDTLAERGVIALVRALFPKATGAPNVGCNLNLPGSVTQHYHVDSAFLREFAIVNVAAVDTNAANGAIDVIPGTHRRFYKYWRFALERPYAHAVRVPLEPGDVLIRTSNLWHRGMPNRTRAARPMLALTWEDGGSALADPYRFADGRIAFRPNWFRTSLLGQLRERTFVAAPITYAAYRFARSLVGTKGYDRP